MNSILQQGQVEQTQTTHCAVDCVVDFIFEQSQMEYTQTTHWTVYLIIIVSGVWTDLLIQASIVYDLSSLKLYRIYDSGEQNRLLVYLC